MKYLLYFKVFAFIFVINSALAQEGAFLIDSTRETLTMGYGTYTKTKQYYYYNNFNQLKLLDIYTNKNSFPDTADWQNTVKAYHYYDSQQRVVKDSSVSRKAWENSWSGKYKMEHEYSDTTTIKTSYSWDFAFGNWNKGERYIDTLRAPEDMETSYLRQYWWDPSGQWENDLWVDTVFFQSGLIDSIYKTLWVVGDPSVTQSSFTKYDYTLYPDTLLIYHWEIGYYILNKIYYTEDSLKKYKFSYKTTLDTVVTDTLYRTIYFFDDEQRVIKYESANWNPWYHDWVVSAIITYEYNEKGLLIQKDYIGGGPTQRTKYEYNDDDLLWKQTYYDNADDLTYFTTDYYYYSYTYVSTPEQVANNFQEIVFYPNPSNSVIHFNWNTDAAKQYMIYDITGRMVTQGKLFNRENTIDVSNLLSGYYIVVISSVNKISQGRFIKY